MPYPVVYCLLVYLGELLATKLCFCFQVEVGGTGPLQVGELHLVFRWAQLVPGRLFLRYFVGTLCKHPVYGNTLT